MSDDKVVNLPTVKAPPAPDPIKGKIVLALEQFMASQGPLSEEQQQLLVASYFSGMMQAAHWLRPRDGKRADPVALGQKVAEMAQAMGMKDARVD